MAGEAPFDHEVAIIGTGFSGLGAAIALDRAGISRFVLLEKAADIGGTWRDNRYPGACCDVPSHLYSFSFELNPDWSRRYSPADEIWTYLQRLRSTYRLDSRIRHGFEVVSAEYSDGGWNLLSRGNERLRVRYLLSAVGALHLPHKPQFKDIDKFRGQVMHSAEWDQDLDPSGKEIIVVGSAASAVQIIPELAKTAARLTVMQRTANYLVARRDRSVSRFEQSLFHALPFVQRLFRWRQYLINDFLFHANFMNRPSPARWLVHRLVRRHMQAQVRDPSLLEKLTPTYRIGCKRVLLSDDYLPAFARDNVALVTDGIDRFTERGLVTGAGQEIEADLVVLATGFQTRKPVGDIQVTGPGGTSLDQAWADGIRAHRSVAVTGFPNFFLVYGPNSNLGHSSVIIMIEQQARYLARLLNAARNSGRPTIEVRPEAEAAWNRKIQHALQKTVWHSGCKSWYQDEKGRIFTLWPFTTTRFILEMRQVRKGEWRFFDEKAAP
jgi:cation diffusion facilitator CzcD-associated flavoprotein CzcO